MLPVLGGHLFTVISHATDDVKEVAKQMEKEEVVAQEEEQHYHRGR